MSKKTTNDVKTTLRLDKDKHIELKKYCIDQGITMKDFFNNCIDKALKNYNKEQKK